MQQLLSTLKFITQHPLSSKRPMSAVWRYGKWQIESRLREEVEVNWIESAKLVARNGMTGATGNIYCGLHEFADMAFLLHLLRSGDLFVDAGANIGSYTVLASAVCEARTIAVEPDPGTMAALKRNVEANQIEDCVRLVEAALGANTGTTQFTVGRDTANRVADETDPQTREVSVKRLDKLLAGRAPVFIKMDVEGYEAEVLRGAGETLRNPALLAIQTETVDEGVTGILQDADFRCWSYDPYTRRLSADLDGRRHNRSNNALFLRNVDLCRERLEAAAKRYIVGQHV